MDTGQENLTQAEKEKKKTQTPPKCRTARPFLLLPGQTAVKPKVKIQEDSPREKQQQLFCQRNKSGLSYVNTEVPTKCLPNFRITFFFFLKKRHQTQR